MNDHHTYHPTQKIYKIVAALTITALLLNGCGAVSGQGSLHSASGSAVSYNASEDEMAQQTRGADVIRRAKSLPIEEKKQFQTIINNWQQWDLNYLTLPSENAEPEEWMAFIEDFDITLLDLDQDGYLEIMTLDIRGKANISEFHIYEVAEDGKSLREWTFSGADDVDPKWYEYPADAYYDSKNRSWHYFATAAGCWGGQEDTLQVFDMEMRDNRIHTTKIGWEKYDFTKDDNNDTSYYDAEGTKVSKEAFSKLKTDFYEGMEKYSMFHHWDYVNGADCYDDDLKQNQETMPESPDRETLLKEITWSAEDKESMECIFETLWAAFEIRQVKRADGWEQRLTDDEKKQLRTIARDGEWYPVDDPYEDRSQQIYYDYDPFRYMVADLDSDGNIEIVLSCTGWHAGTSLAYTSIYEVSEDRKRLKALEQEDENGEEINSNNNIMDHETAVTYWDEKKGLRYYVFENCVSEVKDITGEATFINDTAISLQKNRWIEESCGASQQRHGDKTTYYIWEIDKEVSKEEYERHRNERWEGMSRGTVAFGWKETSAACLERMTEEYLYEELAESYLRFAGK